MHDINIAHFSETTGLIDELECLIVVKSQNQLERRKRMLAGKKGDRFGRVKPRPTATGLLVRGTFRNSRLEPAYRTEFREPRHIVPLSSGGFLLTEMDRLDHIDLAGTVLSSYEHPFFAFLHTCNTNHDRTRALVVSSGYDCVLEIDLLSHECTRPWFAWEHGFNPDEDGVWLAARKDIYDKYLAEGKEALLVNPSEYGEQGLLTARRSVHPNAAVYEPENDSSFILSTGHGGNLYRVDFSQDNHSVVCDGLSQMPHGITPFGDGWAVANTTKGEWWIMDHDFHLVTRFSTTDVPGNVTGSAKAEWLQTVVPIDGSTALFVDANRGILAVNFSSRQYSLYQTDPNWCIQDLLPL